MRDEDLFRKGREGRGDCTNLAIEADLIWSEMNFLRRSSSVRINSFTLEVVVWTEAGEQQQQRESGRGESEYVAVPVRI